MRASLPFLLSAIALGCRHENPGAPPSTAPAAASKEGPGHVEATTDEQYGAIGLRYVGLLRDGRWDEMVAMHDPKMAEALPPAKARELWQSLIAKLGPLLSTAVERVERGPAVRSIVKATFAKTAIGLSVNLDARSKVTGFFIVPLEANAAWSAPEYASPESFDEIEVSFGDPPFELPATLTLPKTDHVAHKTQAVVLVHGSGPNDRDETEGRLRVFKDLAWGLASRGIAVLRYEKVTRVHGKVWLEKWGDDITLDRETTNDGVAAVAWLRKRPEIDPARIVVLGHSQGGLAAPRIAKADPKLAGIIAFAAPTRALEDICLDQYEYIARMQDARGEHFRTELPALRAAVQRVKSSDLNPMTPKEQLPLSIPAPFWLDLRGYHPEALAATLHKPILVLQGEADYQVTMKDFEGWKRGLAGKSFATFRSFPHLEHAFVDCSCDKAKPGDSDAPAHVAKDVIDTIAKWIGGL